MLSEIAKSQPHAAFSALTHGLLRKWTCRSRVVPKINHLLVPLDDLLRTNLIPAITGRSPPNDLEYDALALRYGWTPFHLPSKCECGNSFNVEHALSCRKGGFPSLRHNEIRDITASLLTEVCSEVCTEPDLQPVTPDQLDGASANSQDGARLDVSANGVWGGRFQKTYFDVRVFNILACSNKNQALAAVYRKHELEKKRVYQQRILEVEHSSFTPLVLSATGGMGNEATTFYKRLATLLAQKLDSPLIQHDPMLVTMPPKLLLSSILQSSNQRCQILSRKRSEATNCH